MAHVAVAIPTFNSGDYIAASLGRLRGELRDLARNHRVTLIVCLNGTRDGGRARAEIGRFMAVPGEPFASDLVELEQGGKNRALDALAERARVHRAGYIHFLDDDVTLRPGTLAANTAVLLDHAGLDGRITLVGARFRSVDRPLGDFLAGRPWSVAGWRRWFWHNVFRNPFDSPHDSPAFCSGQCMGLALEHMPGLPPDDTGITDDTYLSNYAAIHGRIVKPEGSEVYFHVSTDPGEWLRQQIRTYLGIVLARDHFIGHERFIEALNAWPYCHIPSCRIPPTGMTLRRRLFHRVFLRWSDKVSLAAEGLRHVEWGAAASTKNVPTRAGRP